MKLHHKSHELFVKISEIRGLPRYIDLSLLDPHKTSRMLRSVRDVLCYG